MAHTHLTEMLDLDAEVLHDYHHEVLTWAGSLAPARARVVDLGAGTGTGTLALARHLPEARVVAVDVDEAMLEHVRHRAAAAGLADRVGTVRADLDQPWPPLGPADLVWASASLHHMADPGHALAQALATLRPGGALMVAELGSFPHFLPDGAGGGVEARAQAALAAKRTEAGLHMDEDWGALLAAAGFTVEADRHFAIDLRPPLPAAAGRYARVCLERMRDGLADRLGADDLAALGELADGIAGRDDLVVRTSRTVWVGRRP